MAFELGTAFMKVLPDLKGFNQQVAKSIDAKKLSKGAAIAGGAIAVGLAVGAKRAIDRASDLNEAVSATDQTFDRSARKVQEWSKNTNDAFSRTDYLGAAKSFGVFARAANLGDDATADFAKSMVDAAGDLASFHNAAPTDVLQDLRSGLAGETEPLRKYGILINEASLQQEGMRLGLVKQGEQLEEHDKVLARRSLILGQLGAAEGDWARTIDSAANQERLQQANSEDLQAQLGQGLLPIYQRLLAVGIKIVAWLTEHTTVAKALFIGLGILAGGLLALSLALKIATVANTLFNVSIGLTAGIVLGIILVLVALGAALIIAWRKSETFRRIVTAVWEGVRAAAEAAWSWIRDNVPPIFKALWNYFLKYLPVIAFIRHFNKIKNAIVGAWEWVSTNTTRIWNGILGAVESFVNKIIDILNYIPGVDIGHIHIAPTGIGPGTGSRPQPGGVAEFAKGGLVHARAGGVYRVAERGHPEMVIPLDRNQRHRATDLLVQTAQRLGLVTDYGLGGLVSGAVDVVKGAGERALRSLPGVNLLFLASDLLKRLPGIPGNIAPWARGVFSYAKGKAGDFIRRRAPGVGGSLVEIGRQLQAMGYLVGEHPAFGGVNPVHTPTSWHYKGRAIDVNWPVPGVAEMAALDRLFAILSKIPHLELLWRVAGHFDHLHFAMARGGAVRAHEPHLVGEEGMELFVPSTSGHIIPNHELRQGGYAIVDLERAMVWVQEVAEGAVAGRARLTRQTGRMRTPAPALGVSS